MKRSLFFVFFTVIFAQFCFFNCAKQSVKSFWADETMTIDGQISEWQAAMQYDEKLDASYGFQNDDEFLYVALETGNPQLQRQLLMSGLVVWLNDTGDKTKDVGFKFPRGLMERQKPARDVMATINNSQTDDQRLNYVLEHNFRDMQVLDPKNKNLGIYTHKEAAVYNIQFDLSMAHGLMIYEMKIPLKCSAKHPWDFSNISTAGIGFATPEMDFSQLGGRRPMGGGMMEASQGSGGGRGGGMGGGMGAGEPGGMGGMRGGFGQSKPINVWVSATMATQN
jgi:hypothetical protein